MAIQEDRGRTNGVAELSREESPEIFFRLFSQATGMQKGEDFEPKPDPTGLAKEATVVGAVVVGSSVREGSRPKDLDILLVVGDSEMTSFDRRLNEYMAHIACDFDIAYSKEKGVMVETGRGGQNRLDVVGFFHYECEPTDELCAFATGALRRNKGVLVFALTPEVVKVISQKVAK